MQKISLLLSIVASLHAVRGGTIGFLVFSVRVFSVRYFAPRAQSV